MKIKVKLCLLVILIAIILLTSCHSSDGESNDEQASEAPVATELNTYEYAKSKDEFKIDAHGVTLTLKYDEKANSFSGLVNSTLEKIIDKMIIDIYFETSKVTLNKEYADVKPGEINIVIPALTTSLESWRADLTLVVGGEIKTTDQNAVVLITPYGETIPDDGLVINGYRYAAKHQSYHIERNGVAIFAQFNDKDEDFNVSIENTTDKMILGLTIGIEMYGCDKIDWLGEYNIDGNSIYGWIYFHSFAQEFDLWKPIIKFEKDGIDDTKDIDSEIVIGKKMRIYY